MGYAFNAVADDATALSWNPAGIVQIKKPELAFSNSLKNTEYRHASYEYDYKPVYSVDFLGFVYPIKLKKKNLVFGASYQNKWNFKFDFENLPSEYSHSIRRKHINRKFTFPSVEPIRLTCLLALASLITNGFHSEINRRHMGFITKKRYVQKNLKNIRMNQLSTTRSYKYSGNNLTIGILFDFSTWHFPLKIYPEV